MRVDPNLASLEDTYCTDQQSSQKTNQSQKRSLNKQQQNQLQLEHEEIYAQKQKQNEDSEGQCQRQFTDYLQFRERKRLLNVSDVRCEQEISYSSAMYCARYDQYQTKSSIASRKKELLMYGAMLQRTINERKGRG